MQAECIVPAGQWPAWWNTALQVLERLQEGHAHLGKWLEQLREVDPDREGFDPLAASWRKLRDAWPVTPI